jgi:malate dehydrogenase
VHIAIVGATGNCGRQAAAQLIERDLLSSTDVLHLIGHAGGAHENSLWGLRADLRDAFADRSPDIAISNQVAATQADVVVMIAGATVTRDTKDRAALAERNRKVFMDVAQAVGDMGNEPLVVVQSNPVEIAVAAFAAVIPRHRVLAAAAWSDSLRFRRELAADLEINRSMVHAEMWGQHGDHMVPMWSRIRATGVSDQQVAHAIGMARADRSLVDLPAEISENRSRMLEIVESGDVRGAYAFVQQQPADIRAAIKPFFTHFTADHTTEFATAHAVVDVLAFIQAEQAAAFPAQVFLDGEIESLHGPLAVPITVARSGWGSVPVDSIADDERAALVRAEEAITATLT